MNWNLENLYSVKETEKFEKFPGHKYYDDKELAAV